MNVMANIHGDYRRWPCQKMWKGPVRSLFKRLAGFLGLFFAIVIIANAEARAEPEFYKGKTIDFYIGFTPGGGYDAYARLVARHLGKHLPGNPTVVPKNMPGAGSLTLANWLFNAAPKDGTVIGTVARSIPFENMFGTPGAQFDLSRINWIGSANNEVSVIVTWHTSGIETLPDLLGKPFVAAGSSPASEDNILYMLNAVLGTKMKIVMGYPGGNEIDVALERGEADGRIRSWSSLQTSKAAWLAEKKINVPVQLSLTKHKDIPDVPLITEAAKTQEQLDMFRLVLARNIIGRPIFAPPGVDGERIELLRAAFDKTMTDSEFLAEAEKAKMEINPVSGKDVEKLMQEILKTPPDIIKKTAEVLKGP